MVSEAAQGVSRADEEASDGAPDERPTIAELFKSYKGKLEKKKRPEADKRWGPIADFWRTVLLSEIEAQSFKDFFAWRRKRISGITPHTLHKDITLIRQALPAKIGSSIDRMIDTSNELFTKPFAMDS